jgi:hypothetical protein
MTVTCLEIAMIARESCLNVPGAIMKRNLVVLAVAAVFGWPFAPSHAAPPTATPSPGYDARLQEQRRAASTTTFYEPLAPVAKPAAPRHRKKTSAH